MQKNASRFDQSCTNFAQLIYNFLSCFPFPPQITASNHGPGSPADYSASLVLFQVFPYTKFLRPFSSHNSFVLGDHINMPDRHGWPYPADISKPSFSAYFQLLPEFVDPPDPFPSVRKFRIAGFLQLGRHLFARNRINRTSRIIADRRA